MNYVKRNDTHSVAAPSGLASLLEIQVKEVHLVATLLHPTSPAAAAGPCASYVDRGSLTEPVFREEIQRNDQSDRRPLHGIRGDDAAGERPARVGADRRRARAYRHAAAVCARVLLHVRLRRPLMKTCVRILVVAVVASL